MSDDVIPCALTPTKNVGIDAEANVPVLLPEKIET